MFDADGKFLKTEREREGERKIKIQRAVVKNSERRGVRSANMRVCGHVGTYVYSRCREKVIYILLYVRKKILRHKVHVN